MDYDGFLARRLNIDPQPAVDLVGHSGYFSKPQPGFDSRLLDDSMHFKPRVRAAILKVLYDFWDQRYERPETWSKVWVAGSALSHQWAADRGGVGDLDVLVGVDHAKLIQYNPEFRGIPEPLIDKRFNAEFNKLLNPFTVAREGETWAQQLRRMAGDVHTVPKVDPLSTVGGAGPAALAISRSTTSSGSTGSPSKTSSNWFERKTAGAGSAVMSSSDARERSPQRSTTITPQEQFEGSSAGRVTSGLGSSETASRESNGSSRISPGGFEITWYVNPRATDIRDIHPYAAYNLSDDEWTVKPVELPDDWDPHTYFSQEWWAQVNAETNRAREIVQRYHQQTAQFDRLTPGSPQWVNAMRATEGTIEQASAMFEDIHSGRKNAFGPQGKGYFDYYNFRWQAHKNDGTIDALRKIRVMANNAVLDTNAEKYGTQILGNDEATIKASLWGTKFGQAGILVPKEQ